MKHAMSQLNHCKLTCHFLIFFSNILLDFPTSPLAYIFTMILYLIDYISQFYDYVILRHSSGNVLSKRTLDLLRYLHEFYQSSCMEINENRVVVITVAEIIRAITECNLKYILNTNCTGIVKCCKLQGFVEFQICHSVNWT
jgi:hypothetical protein